MFKGKTVVVTGGAGFIGSHVVDYLLSQGAYVKVIDNMKTGQISVVEKHKKNRKRYHFRKADINSTFLMTSVMQGADCVFHMAANADIRGGIDDTYVDLKQNLLGTHTILEAMRRADVKRIAFASSGAVYGIQNKKFATYEYATKIQNSLYGASKVSAEAFIEAYGEYYGNKSSIFRFVSVIGERYTHGVIIDFYRKLLHNKLKLEILGNGKQKKSYIYVKDCVKGMMVGTKATRKTEVYNIGNSYTVPVTKVADIVCEEMGLKDVEYAFSSNKMYGWVGDQPVVKLNTFKLSSLGWKPEVGIETGIRRTVKYLMG